MDAYVNYVFQISVHEWYTAFSSGFLKVCGGKVLELFQPSELRAMMVGNSNYNWQELEEVSRDGTVFTSEEAAVACQVGPEPGLFPGGLWLRGHWRPPNLAGYFLLSTANGAQMYVLDNILLL